MDHFKGIVPDERWKNDLLNEVRKIRELLERDAQTINPVPEVQEQQKRKYTRRGDK